MRLLGQRVHLVQVEGAVHWPVLRARAGPASRGAFDDVRTGPHHPANRRADIREAVDDPIRQQWIIRHATGKPGRADAVADPADRRDDAQRDDEPRPGDQPLVDRPLEPGVETGGVAHRGVSHRQGLLQDLGGAQGPGALRLVNAPAPRQIIAVHRHMVVAIDQAGQDRHAGDIDNLGILRPLAGGFGGDRLDPLIADHDRSARLRSGAGSVDQPSALQHLHLSAPSSCGRRSQIASSFTMENITEIWGSLAADSPAW